MPGALFVKAPEIDPAHYIGLLQNKSIFFAELPVAQGLDWLVVFGAGSKDDALLLPHIPGATPIYQALPDCWFPVGTALDMPETVQVSYVSASLEQHNLTRLEVVIIPEFGDENTAHNIDVYAIRDQVMLGDILAEGPAL